MCEQQDPDRLPVGIVALREIGGEGIQPATQVGLVGPREPDAEAGDAQSRSRSSLDQLVSHGVEGGGRVGRCLPHAEHPRLARDPIRLLDVPAGAAPCRLGLQEAEATSRRT